MNRCPVSLSLILVLLRVSVAEADTVEVVSRPYAGSRNTHYVSNRPPLVPSELIGLPVGAVRANGWLHEYLVRQRDGLTGNLGNISVWLQKEGNAWLSGDGKGEYGWEELPYWLKGYGDLAYLLDDPDMIAETKVWIEGALNSQRPNGDFGPDQRFKDGTRDFWANMIMLFCLQSYHDYSGDTRVLDLMTRYFHFQATVPDSEMLTGYWQRMRGGDNLYSIYWLYNRTGDESLLPIAEKIHRNTANWKMADDLPNWHNVNIAQAFGEPATHYLQTHDTTDLTAAYANFFEVRKRFGGVPGGMFGGDENCRPGYDDPRQAVETCGLVEQMLSDETLLRISGDPFWADHCEEVAFNVYPAAVMPDFRALRYLTAPNMVVSDRKNHKPGIDNGGPFLMMNPFSSRCCQHNHSHGWPYFVENLWMATPDNGACAAMYGASTAAIKVGDSGEVTFSEETHYPFEEQIRVRLSTSKSVIFPLYLRVPNWCGNASVEVNGEALEVSAAPARYIRIEREWRNGDVVTLDLPMELKYRRWGRHHDAISVVRGPLTYSLKIGERYDRFDGSRTAQWDSKWQKDADPSQWPAFEIHPTTDWNYGLVIDDGRFEFEVRESGWPVDDFPFTQDAVPVSITAKARKIPEWTLDQYGLCAVLQDSPALTEEPVETVTLIPMGAARLRVSAFPTVGTGTGAHRWTKPEPYKPGRFRADASCIYDQIDALSDGIEPSNSNDQSIPRFTWWDHKGTEEWVEYDFNGERAVSSVAVYWFDDTGVGQCRVPRSWRLDYREGDSWKPVATTQSYLTKRDDWNGIGFPEVRTSGLRLNVRLKDGFSGGILEWRIE